jgi:phosphoenolpyruvate-protein kinase (PTS system EI component)
MATVKERILRDIESIDDETVLEEVYRVLQELKGAQKLIQLNEEQIQKVEEAREDYRQGRYSDTKSVFKRLSDD